MKAKLAVYCPTYKRPHTLQALVDNLKQTTTCDYKLYFGVEREDKASYEMAKQIGAEVIVNAYDPGYSGTIQTMYEKTNEPFWTHSNDDFQYLPGWDEAPLSMFERPDLMVVGMKQNETDSTYSAVHMVRRSYIETMSGVIDMPNRCFYPYHHNYQDTEMTQTAQFRGVWAACHAHGINHIHPVHFGREKDDTYKKNDETSPLDEVTFNSRKHLWAQ